MVKKILCLAGGGIKGIASATVLKNVEEYLYSKGTSIYNFFDVFAGTSIGSLLIAGLVYSDMTGIQLYNELLNEENINIIMDGNSVTQQIRLLNNYPKYNGIGKRKVLRKYFKNKRLKDTSKMVIMTSYKLGIEKVDNIKEPFLFKSYDSTKEIFLVDACDSSSAAPSFFPAVDVQYMNEIIQCVDGGIYANDPSLYAYVECKNRYPDENIKLFFLGTGLYENNYIPMNNIGMKSWLIDEDLLSLMISGTQLHNKYILQHLLSNYLYINGHVIDYSIDNKSKKNINDLKNSGNKWFLDHHNEILLFFYEKHNFFYELSRILLLN